MIHSTSTLRFASVIILVNIIYKNNQRKDAVKIENIENHVLHKEITISQLINGYDRMILIFVLCPMIKTINNSIKR